MIFADDLKFPEGPLWLPDGSWLVTEMERGIVTRLNPDGSRRELAATGSPNGLALADDGMVWIAESVNRSLICLDIERGDATTILREVDGQPLLWPNDLCFGPDGAIYATDTGVLRSQFTGPGWPEDSLIDGRVFRYDPRSGQAWFIDTGLRLPNGIAFGPDGLLYVNETMTGDIYRYALNRGRAIGARERFGNVMNPAHPEAMGGPDGMAFSNDGRLWTVVFGQGEIAVLDTSGTVVERLPAGGLFPTNCAFGEPGRLYVVESETGSMRVVDVAAEGLPLHG